MPCLYSTAEETQGPVHARRALCQLSHMPSPWCFPPQCLPTSCPLAGYRLDSGLSLALGREEEPCLEIQSSLFCGSSAVT